MTASESPRQLGRHAARRTSVGARRSSASERAILAAARDVLSERGYGGFSIDEVARRAGAGKPTIYRWWPTKAELFMALYGAEKDDAIAVPDTGDLAADLTDYTVSLWRFWRSHPAGMAFRALVAEAQGSPVALEALRARFLPERLVAVRRLFEKGASGEDPSEIEDRLELWAGFNWLKVLTGRLDDEARIGRVVRLLAR